MRGTQTKLLKLLEEFTASHALPDASRRAAPAAGVAAASREAAGVVIPRDDWMKMYT